MDRDAIRAYARRDRTAVEDSKRERWVALHREGGAEAMLELGWTLIEHARLVRPEWPTARDREVDRADHERLALLIERARDAFARR